MARAWHRSAAVAICLSLGAAPVVAASPPADLRQALDQALTLAPAQTGAATGSLPGEDSNVGEGGDWLAAPPLVSSSYLASQEPWGTDELELSVSLPLFSPEQRRRNAALLDLDPALEVAGSRYRRWQLTGVLRDLYARHRRAVLARDLGREQERELIRLELSAREQQAAGSLESFDLWLIGQSLRDIRTAVARHQSEVAAMRRAFNALTGFSDLPPTAGEPEQLPRAPAYDTHPEAELQQALQDQQLAAVRAGSPRLTPWTVGVVGRELEVAGRAEWQYGLALSIPLNLGGRETVSVRSSAAALRRQFLLQRDRWLAELRRRWEGLWAERDALLAERRLLTARGVGAELESNLRLVREGGEMPIEIRVQRLLTLLESTARPQHLEAELKAVEAKLLQVAGIGL